MVHEQWQQFLAEAAAGAVADAGIGPVSELAVVRFEGINARSFLQGYLTCDMDDLAHDALLPTALCNLKGRVVMNGWCTTASSSGATNGQDVLVVLHESLVDHLAEFLKRYLMFSRNTRLVDQRRDVLVLGGLDLPAGSGGLAVDERRRLFVQGDVDEARALWERHPHLAPAAWHASLTADGIPLVSAPVSEVFLPQMLNLERFGAIDFEKGCYLGQEVVARAQHRGQVKRRLARLRWQGDAAPASGADITDGTGKAQGAVLQSTAGAGSGVLLAVLREDAADDLRQGDTYLRRIS